MTSLKIKSNDGKRRVDMLGMQAAIMHCIYRMEPVTVSQVYEIIREVRESPVCERTIRRHMDALHKYGFIRVEIIKRSYLPRPVRLYYASDPVLLNQAIERYLTKHRGKKNKA